MGKKKNIYKSYGGNSSSDSEDIIKLIKTIGIVVLVLFLFYLVFAIYNGEISFSKKEKEKEEVQIQNVEILATSTFTRPESDYYVLFYDFDGDASIRCSSIRTLFTDKTSGIKMYTVNLGNTLSKNYLASDAASVNAKNLASLKVIDATLVKVSNGTGEVIASGIDELINYSNELLNISE